MNPLMLWLHESPAPHIHAGGATVFGFALAATVLAALLAAYVLARHLFLRSAAESRER